MAVKYVMKVWLFTECKRLLIKFWWVSLALTAKFGAIKPTILRWTSTIFFVDCDLFFYMKLLNVCERCVGRQKREDDNLATPSEYIKEKAWLYWTTHLSVSTSVPLTVNPGSIALHCPSSPVPFLLPALFPLLLSLSSYLTPSLSVCSDASSWLTAHKMK